MEIEKAFKRLLIKNPFYGLFCLNLPKEVTRSIPTLCVTKKGISCQLNINPDFWEQHTDEEQIALLQHELGHIIHQHMFLSDSFANKKLFNVAADCEVNSYIDNLPQDACTAASLGEHLGIYVENGLGTKKYYELLTQPQNQQKAEAKNPSQPCNGGLGGENTQQEDPLSSEGSKAPSDDTPDNSQEDKDREKQQPSPSEQSQEDTQEVAEEPQEYPDGLKDTLKPMDSHDTWKEFSNLPEANKQLITNTINNIVKNTAEQVEKMRGTIPGEFSELVEKLREKKPEMFNWKAYFRRLLGSIYDVNIRSTRRKESKRFSGSAGIQHKKKVSILVAIDTSGSVSNKELQEFFSEIDYIYKAGARITIIECDTRINSVTEYDGKNLPEIKGRGGTDFNPPVDYYVEHQKEYASMVYFTDGEAPLPTKRPQGLVWLISSMGCHQDFPGKTIYIPKEQQ